MFNPFKKTAPAPASAPQPVHEFGLAGMTEPRSEKAQYLTKPKEELFPGSQIALDDVVSVRRFLNNLAPAQKDRINAELAHHFGGEYTVDTLVYDKQILDVYRPVIFDEPPLNRVQQQSRENYKILTDRYLHDISASINQVLKHNNTFEALKEFDALASNLVSLLLDSELRRKQ